VGSAAIAGERECRKRRTGPYGEEGKNVTEAEKKVLLAEKTPN